MPEQTSSESDGELLPAVPDAKSPSGEKSRGLMDQLRFGLSMPERMLRSTTALVGGTVQEMTVRLLPGAFRSSRSYAVVVQQSLDFLLQNVGGVATPLAAAPPPGTPEADEFVARKVVGSFLDFAGMATLHLSPLIVLAIVSDVAYGSQSYLRELSEELKRNGVIDQDATIDRAADLLSAVQSATNKGSQVFDAPPLSIDGLKKTLAETTEAVRNVDPTTLIPQAELSRMWNSIHEQATKSGVSPFEMSSALAMYTANQIGTLGRSAMSSVTVAGNLFDRHILDHYRNGLKEVREQGLFTMLSTCSARYVDAVWLNFSYSKTTLTEDLLTGELLRKGWNFVGSWFGPIQPEEPFGNLTFELTESKDPPPPEPPT